MFVLIDNYDSFTYNLVQYLGDVGVKTEVYRNDRISVREVLAKRPEGIILSPGPRDPDRAGICLELIERAAGRLPIFGVCLGHQAIGQAFGGKVIRAPEPRHGKVSEILHRGGDILTDVPNPFHATRYHSLCLDPENLPKCLSVAARSEDGVIMALRHNELPIYGVQFHPESIASEYGHRILQNFVTLAQRYAA